MRNHQSAFCNAPATRGLVLLALAALLLGVLGACSPGHSGGSEIAFVRGGALWELDQDGRNLHQVASGQVVGFSWSPDHHQIVLRLSHGPPPGGPHPLGFDDLKSEAEVISVDGGDPLQITPPDSGLARSDAWWDASGNRLLYREAPVGAPGQLAAPHWELSQADQPAGIARKALPASVVLPAVTSDGSQIASIDASGRVLVGAPGGTTTVVARGAATVLPDAPGYPARPLWQPGTGALLYAVVGPTPAVTILLLRSRSGAVQPLLTVAHLQQYAWSPNGHALLVRTASQYQLYSASGVQRLTWDDASVASLPFWSPDSHALLILEPDAVTLVQATSGQRQTLLRGAFAFPPAPSDTTLALWWRLATSSPWNRESTAVLFTNDGQGIWQAQPAKPLPTEKGSGDGAYLVTLAQPGNEPRFPTLVDWGDHQSLAWTTLDPNSAFLMG